MVPAAPTSVADVFRRRAIELGDRPALICEDRTTTYAALDRRTNQVARALRRRPSSQRGIALLDTNSDIFFELLGGAAKAGQSLVPVNWRLQTAEIAAILNDAGVDTLMLGAQFANQRQAILDACPEIQTVIVIDPSAGTGDPYRIWRESESDADVAAGAGTEPLLHVYTSGTEGLPRGVRLTSDNMMVGAPTLAIEFGEAVAGETALVCLPLFHVSGSLWGLASLYAGATCVVLRTFDPAAVLRATAAYRIAKMFLVPTLIRMLLQADDLPRTDLSSLRLIVYGASPMPLPLMRDALSTLHCDFAQVYGLTESCGAVTYLRPEDHDLSRSDRLLSCGRPLGGVEILVVDERGAPLPVGSLGEIVCRTAQNMSGYWRQADGGGPFFRGSWLRTGDVGRLDADGFLYISDRLKDVVITGGENVFPAEVERALLECPGVADAAVIGIPDERWGEAVHGVVVRRSESEVAENDILAFARARLAGYKVPRRIEFVDALPRNSAGKVLKRALREPYWRGRSRQVN